MAGHSKWANIQHRKGRQDKLRSKLFSKLSKDITIAAKMGGPDVDMNPRLRLAVTNAKGQSMPKDNIQRAIDKGCLGEGGEYEDIRYEGFASGGVGLIVEASTDNKNRAAMEVRTAFSKNGGNLGETGSVAFMFEQIGEISYLVSIGDEDSVMEMAMEVGATDMQNNSSDGDEEGEYIFYTERDELAQVAEGLAQKYGDAKSVNLIWRAPNLIDVPQKAASIIKMIEVLEELDDVRAVFHNLELSEAALATLDE